MDYGKLFSNHTTELRRAFNQEKMKTMAANDPLLPYKPHKLGHIPAFYPQNKLNAVRHFSEVMKENEGEGRAKTIENYKDVLAKVTAGTAIPQARRSSNKVTLKFKKEGNLPDLQQTSHRGNLNMGYQTIQL